MVSQARSSPDPSGIAAPAQPPATGVEAVERGSEVETGRGPRACGRRGRGRPWRAGGRSRAAGSASGPRLARRGGAAPAAAGAAAEVPEKVGCLAAARGRRRPPDARREHGERAARVARARDDVRVPVACPCTPRRRPTATAPGRREYTMPTDGDTRQARGPGESGRASVVPRPRRRPRGPPRARTRTRPPRRGRRRRRSPLCGASSARLRLIASRSVPAACCDTAQSTAARTSEARAVLQPSPGAEDLEDDEAGVGSDALRARDDASDLGAVAAAVRRGRRFRRRSSRRATERRPELRGPGCARSMPLSTTATLRPTPVTPIAEQPVRADLRGPDLSRGPHERGRVRREATSARAASAAIVGRCRVAGQDGRVVSRRRISNPDAAKSARRAARRRRSGARRRRGPRLPGRARARRPPATRRRPAPREARRSVRRPPQTG